MFSWRTKLREALVPYPPADCYFKNTHTHEKKKKELSLLNKDKAKAKGKKAFHSPSWRHFIEG